MLKRVMTKYGIVEGVSSNAGYAFFKGIPYAKAPIGDLRFRAPQECDKWEGVLKCDTFGPACPQYDRWSKATDDITDDSGHPYIHIKNYPYPPKMDEDCLYLNIETPAESRNEKLPVLFYIHGGGLQQWYGSDYEYCGDAFCKEGCILVTIHYRLNVFGYFAHPDLEKENDEHSSGNYGLLDQLMALRWVYENIEGFGGDPNNITCFGQSAGGTSAISCFCSPKNNHYIHNLSLQSCGGLESLMREKTKEEIYQQGKRFMEACGCSSVDELRKLDWHILRDKNDALFGMMDGFGINLDASSLPIRVKDCLKSGILKDVGCIVGCTVDEGANDKEPIFGLNLYASNMALANHQILQKLQPIYSYVFARIQPGDDAGVPHSCDNRYQFHSLDGSWRPYTKEDDRLSLKMVKYWANFAKTGNPNGNGLEEWIPVTLENSKSMKFDIESCQMVDFTKDNPSLVKMIQEFIEG